MLLRAQGERLSTACGEGHLLFPQQSGDKMLLMACQDHGEALPQLVDSFSCEGPTAGAAVRHLPQAAEASMRREKSLGINSKPRRSNSWAPRNTWEN